MHSLSKFKTIIVFLAQSIGEFVLSHPDIKMEPRGKPIYSINEGNAMYLEEPVVKYLESIKYRKVTLYCYTATRVSLFISQLAL